MRENSDDIQQKKQSCRKKSKQTKKKNPKAKQNKTKLQGKIQKKSEK